MKHCPFSLMLFTFLSCTALTHAQVIGHKEVVKVEAMTESQLSAIRQQSWLFTHASVGANMIQGMKSLHREDPKKFPLQIKRVKPLAFSQISQLETGFIYDIARGNPGWRKKYDLFEKTIRESTATQSQLIAMDKLCYIDQSADVQVYITMMRQLEKDYPKVRLVYTTMPMMTDENRRNVQRNQYNQVLRDDVIKHHKLLYDIADIESHSPEGQAATFIFEGQQYQKLYQAYTRDGGHLNNKGAKQVAKGWYAVARAIARQSK